MRGEGSRPSGKKRENVAILTIASMPIFKKLNFGEREEVETLGH